jgi:hypothetical protein
MTQLFVGTPVVTEAPSIVVDAGLSVGQHRFQLEVVIDSGQKSQPVTAVVQVQSSTAPIGAAPANPSASAPKTAPTPAAPRTVGARKPRKKKE